MNNDYVKIEDTYAESGSKDIPTIEHYEGTLTENLYKAVVEFIKWYNQQK